MNDGIWIKDPDTGEVEFLYYDDIVDPDVLKQLLQPKAGFCWPAEAFKRVPIVKAPFIVGDGVLPQRGRLIIYGQAKSGKSTLAMQLARCIGSGQPFLSLPTKEATVLYLQSEISEDMLQERLKQSGQDYPNVYVGTRDLKLDTKTGYELFLHALDEVRPGVLIVDPLYKLFTGDENEGKDVRAILDKLDDVIRAYGCSIVLIHHSGKDKDKGSRGSSVLNDWPDAVLELQRLRGKEHRCKLIARLMRHASPFDPIEIVLDNFEFALADEEQRILSIIDNPISTKEIAEKLQCSRRTVERKLNSLISKGKIRRTGRGVYEKV